LHTLSSGLWAFGHLGICFGLIDLGPSAELKIVVASLQCRLKSWGYIMISFLNKDNQEQSGFMGKGDIIFLVVIAALAIGGFWYVKNIKGISYTHFDSCIQMFNEKQLAQASVCFDEAQDLHYKNDSLDKVLYEYSTKLFEMEQAERALFGTLSQMAESQDWHTLHKLHSKLPESFYFLAPEQTQSILTWMQKADSVATELTPNSAMGATQAQTSP
jgi:hypothetical protein